MMILTCFGGFACRLCMCRTRGFYLSLTWRSGLILGMYCVVRDEKRKKKKNTS
ncbi:hypothetical protein BO78DRAFT_72796 [Aspergillus sclerotiicarbonarius CBS 121057]|uniref:Uncharacterized protein n=1 Tax=Aspergillus sclerotiicarbonarius (strain CBS 121057 / IBT 28362) TaxID=1448318 RepID=A0A319EDZ6_ASPSB|nr:hypothetical protein BO78DRAFT_72796 [Aspergillus sclerotiicarbonarius CBS 121057]